MLRPGRGEGAVNARGALGVSSPGDETCTALSPERTRITESADIVSAFLLAGLRPLVLIGGCCFTENADIVSAFLWRASARWCSLAASCRRVGWWFRDAMLNAGSRRREPADSGAG